MGQAFMRILLLVLVLVFAGATGARAQLFETRAPHAYMIDAETGTVLFSKEPDKLIPPASLAKLMTMEVVFNAIKSGRLSLDDTFQVSENAWRNGGAMSGGSTMFAELNSTIRLEDLIKGVIIQSANDGCIVIAEAMGGTVERFAEMMNERAREIGLEKSVFVNPHGLPAEGQMVTVRELVKLSHHIWKEYPDFYRYYSMLDFTWNGIFQRNRNPLLRMDIGADGLKTGYTEESGFAIVGSVVRNGRRLFLAMSGLESDNTRAEEARKMLDWGIRAFETRQIFAEGETVGEAQVYGGEMRGVPLTANGPLAILVPTASADRMIARVVYQGPVKAPVERGQQIGALKVWIGDTLSQETPLYAAGDVAVGSLQQRALDAVEELTVGWIRQFR